MGKLPNWQAKHHQGLNEFIYVGAMKHKHTSSIPKKNFIVRYNEDLTLNSGVHSQYFIYNNTFAVEPRLGLKWNVNSKNTLSVAYGMHHQLAPTRLFFKQAEDNFGNIILDNNGTPYIPNKNLKMTRSQHYVAAYDKSLGLHTRLKVEMYYQKLVI